MASPETEAESPPYPPDEDVAAIEGIAVELARTAGRLMTDALTEGFAVEYKTEGKNESEPTDPVSEIDRMVEDHIRSRVGREFPEHGIIGEEVDTHPTGEEAYLWVVDPVDGTSNFINGFPLFSASVGVLHRGRPVAGAIWCGATAALHPGVYHARLGTGLMLDGEPVDTDGRNTGVRRKLAAAPGGSPGRTDKWDNRVTGSAALECAYVAAGIFSSARFGGLRIWDLAAGTLLVEAGGGEAWVKQGSSWHRLDAFEAPANVKEDREPTLRDWSLPMVIGKPDAISGFIAPAKPGLWQRARQLFSHQ
ncbi:MAG: inositol monophosphatase [Dehalococcoidia bacterium]|nr:inositol monophosphatase [Dehalococcoidia bacterium]